MLTSIPKTMIRPPSMCMCRPSLGSAVLCRANIRNILGRVLVTSGEKHLYEV